LNRICTWAWLEEKASRKDFFFFNTHFDHKGVVARERSAELLLEKIKAIAGKKPFFLTGDFNATPDTVPIKRLSAALRESRAVSAGKPEGPVGTFNGFDRTRKLEAPIDYIFVGGAVQVLTYAVLTDSREGRYPSDHLPVVIQAEVG